MAAGWRTGERTASEPGSGQVRVHRRSGLVGGAHDGWLRGRPGVVCQCKLTILAEIEWFGTVPGNLKTILSRAGYALVYSKYGSQYLTALASQFNAYFDVNTLTQRLQIPVRHCGRQPEHEFRVSKVLQK